MPPKGARVGRGGRGASTAASQSDSQIPDANESQYPVNMLNSIPDLAPSSQTVASPNSSPVSAPTETPAPTPARTTAPIRAPVQRLSSLGRGAGLASRGARGARTGTPGATAQAPAGSRFKPKATRRTQEERDQAARDEEARKAARDKDAAFLDRINNRGRGRGRGRGDTGRGRGRGDAMGMRGGMRLQASGPFSQAPASSGQRGGMFAPVSVSSGGGGGSGGYGIKSSSGGASGGGMGGSRIKSENDFAANVMAADGTLIKDEIFDPIYPEEAEEGQRIAKMDIERINLVSDDETSDSGAGPSTSKGKGRAYNGSKGGTRPIRLTREEHKGRVNMINTDSAAATLVKETAPDNDADGDVTEALTRSLDQREREWAGVWKDDEAEEETQIDESYISEPPTNEPQIKADPDGPFNRTASPILGDIMEIDSGTATPAPRDEIKPPLSPIEKKAKRPSMKEVKPVLQTEEDKAEYARHMDDVFVLANELGGLQTAMADDAGDVDLDAQAEQQTQNKEGRLYLFQFPPILPPLLNPVKKEEPADEDADMEMGDIQAAPGRSEAPPVDLTKPETQDAVEIKADPDAPTDKQHARHNTIPEAGLVGKLIVRESGKVELDWGGTSLQLGKGATFDFLTTTMVVDREVKPTEAELQGYGEQGGRKGNGTGMGKISGKFVCTPDWQALFRDGRD